MKRLFIALAVLAASQAQAVNLNQLAQEGICQSNAAVFHPECKTQQTRKKAVSCVMEVQEGRKRFNQTVRLNENQRSIQGEQHVYHEEDSTGSTTIRFNPKTGRGTYSIMDAHEVIASGNVFNCN